MEGLKSENKEIQISSDCKIRITAINGRNFLSNGVLHYARLRTEGQSVLIRNPEAEFTSPSFIKSLVRIEVWGKSLGEIRSER